MQMVFAWQNVSFANAFPQNLGTGDSRLENERTR